MENFNINTINESYISSIIDGSIMSSIITDTVMEHLAAYQEEAGVSSCGVIRKEMLFQDYRGGRIHSATVGVEIDTNCKTIEVHRLDRLPRANALFWALLADPDVRQMIAEYQETAREIPYEIYFEQITDRGRANGNRFLITYGYKEGGFATTETSCLCFIARSGNLASFGNKYRKMAIGDFVELVAFMGLTDDMDVHSLREKSGVKYIMPTLAEDIESFTTRVTRIL